jgi:hypothetical protein
LLSITMVGATSGSALTIQSVANTGGQSVITVTNEHHFHLSRS